VHEAAKQTMDSPDKVQSRMLRHLDFARLSRDSGELLIQIT
jgi:hypothetical protein